MDSKKGISLKELIVIRKDLANEIKNEFPDLFFDYAGIIPIEGEDSKYDCTPINTTIFAMTGGNGVHYSVLELSEIINLVVMTVPMNFGNSIKDYNIILSENLVEFMSLGYYNGWFYLEQLFYNFEKTINLYSGKNKDEEYLSDGDKKFVKKLINKLSLVHRPVNSKRLKELEEMYYDKLVFKQEFIDKL